MLLNGEPFAAPRVFPHVVGTHRDMDESHVFEDIMQLVDWVLDDTATPVTAEHARHVIDIIESGYRSAETGSRQELTTSFDLAALGVVQS